MKRVLVICLFLIVASAALLGQKCAQSGGALRARCSNAGCGQIFTNYFTAGCDIDNVCWYFESVQVCCGAYANYAPTGGTCGLAKYNEKELRSKLVQLSQNSELLVPNCSGAYVPARLVLRHSVEQ